jgi:8-oxo-dGTP diphosphatase
VPIQQFQVGQKALIEKGEEVLVLFSDGGLDLPGGRIDEGEADVVAALKREVREETSLEVEVGEPLLTGIARPGLFLVAYHCRYVSGDVVLSEEHESWRWVSEANYREVDDGTAPLAMAMLDAFFTAKQGREDAVT